MNRAILTVVLLLGSLRPALAMTTLTMVDVGGDVGRHPSLAIGADGLGLIAYWDLTNRNLKVAHCANVPCTSATVSIIDSGDVTEFGGVELAIGADGRGIVAYYDGTLDAVRTAHCNDLACTTATLRTIETAFTGHIGLAIGADGLPLLAYTDITRLHTAHCTVADCSSVTVSDVGPAPDGRPVEVA